MRSCILNMTMFMLASSRHFDCDDICKSHRRINNKTANNNDTPKSGKGKATVPAGKVNCYGKICVVTSEDYNKFEVPQPWTSPVLGTEHGDTGSEYVCKKENTYVLEVDTIFDITGVRGIDVAHESIEVDMYLEMTWADPELGVCVCGEIAEDNVYKVGTNLEDVIWVPDLTVWHFKEFKRINGLVRLNEMELTVHDHCSAELRYAFDVQVKLRCQMEMKFYPYDQNICHIKMGSFSHSSEDLMFGQGEKTSEHSFTKTPYKDYSFEVVPLCAEAMEETMETVGGETSIYKVSGFSLVVTRKSGKILGEYVFVQIVLLLTAIFSSCLPLYSGRAGLVAGTALSVIFVLVLINDYTPHSMGGMNLVLQYSLMCLFFICITYLEYCILMAVLRWPNMMILKQFRKLSCRIFCQMPCERIPCQRSLQKVDKVFFLIWLTLYIGYSYIFWWLTPDFEHFYTDTKCHNERESVVDCSGSSGSKGF